MLGGTVRATWMLLLAVFCTCFFAESRSESSQQHAKTDADAAQEQEPATRLTHDECLAIGFDSEALDCRLCDEMSQIIDEVRNNPEDMAEMSLSTRQTLTNQCMACCTKLNSVLEETTGEQYERAVLEVCTCKFGKYPKVANFVNNKASEHKRLTIKYMNARHPHLLFYDAHDNRMEEVSIASWDEETIAEFLKAKLKTEDPQLIAAEPAVELEEQEDEESQDDGDENDNKDEL